MLFFFLIQVIVQSLEEVEESVAVRTNLRVVFVLFFFLFFQTDQQNQMSWLLRLNPKAALLKFRLPWSDGTTQYLSGEIRLVFDVFVLSFFGFCFFCFVQRLPVWGRATTTECRLLWRNGTDDCFVSYDNTAYNEQMFHFNRVTRVQYYQHPAAAQGHDHCYDCAAEDLVRKLDYFLVLVCLDFVLVVFVRFVGLWWFYNILFVIYTLDFAGIFDASSGPQSFCGRNCAFV
jgi:hypothetical protein